jgi:2-phosphoglycerate kinase
VSATPRIRVLLLLGASGVGKSSVSYPLATRLGWPLVELDDIVEAVRVLTTAEQLPELHYWATHPEAAQAPETTIVGHQIAVARALAPAVRAIVDNHLTTDTPVILEGDYLLPLDLPGVGAVLLHEDDVDQITANLLAREPAAGPQRKRAEVSAAYAKWLARQADEAGVPVVPMRPWTTAIDRVVAALA